MIQLILTLSFAIVFYRRAKLEDRRPYVWAVIGAAVFFVSSSIFHALGVAVTLLGGVDDSLAVQIIAIPIGMILGAGLTRFSMRRFFRSLYAKKLPFSHGLVEPQRDTERQNTINNDGEN